MIRAGVLGSTGYTGCELLRLLAAHPQVEVAFATARAEAGQSLADLIPGAPDVALTRAEDADPGEADVLFLCLPHGAAREWARKGLAAGGVVIDLSADHRLRDPQVYAHWYGQEHDHPEGLDEAVYGLTEWRRDALREARLVANPGCYPTSILLALAPLLRAGLLEGATVIADSKSGVTGAGRSARVDLLHAEVNENLRPYNLGHAHRHVPEIEQELALLADGRAPRGLVFSPHLLPVSRGIVSTLYVPLPGDVDLRALYSDAYAGEAFVSLLPAGRTATLAHSLHTNRCTLSLHEVPEREMLILVSTIDNLLKGAAGQAVQNMNVRFGLPEAAGLPR